jgi:hypothetical protein
MSKMTCKICFKSVCMNHFEKKKHKCKPLKTSEVVYRGYRYEDKVGVFDYNQKEYKDGN